MIEVMDPKTVLDFMRTKFGMRGSEDFRGVLFIPDKYKHECMSMEHVATAYAWDNFVGKTCAISAVIQHPEYFTRGILREAFRFPFEDCGCTAVFALVDSTNTKSITLCTRVGFEAVHRIEQGGRHGDLIVFQMLKSQCRWLKRSH